MDFSLDEPKFTCSHQQAVKRIAAWLRNSSLRCAVVAAERVTVAVTETPDAIGWHPSGLSVLVECKISRADFHRDKKKYFRQYEEAGVGDKRYFAAPTGVLKPEDMPEGWGLLEIGKHQIRETVKPVYKQANKQNEVSMLVAAIRRLEIAATVFVRCEKEPEEKEEYEPEDIYSRGDTGKTEERLRRSPGFARDLGEGMAPAE